MPTFGAIPLWLFLCSCTSDGAPGVGEPASAPVICESTPSPRWTYEPTAKAHHLLSLGQRMGAKGADLEAPDKLERFYAELDLLTQKTPSTEHVRVLTFGNSLISADNVTNIVRERLIERFGSGGRGLLLVDRIAPYGPRTRTGIASKGWEAHNFAIGPVGLGRFGLTGAHHASLQRGARTDWKLDGETRATVFWLDHPQASGFSLRVDGSLLERVKPEKSNRAKALTVALPPSSKSLQLVADGPQVVIEGAVIERESAGVVFDTIGIAGAEAFHFLSTEREATQEQLIARQPSLLLFMLGGNEARRLAFRRTNEAKLTADFSALIALSKAASPADVSCLVVGPIDAVHGAKAKSPMKSRPEVAIVTRIEREVAQAQGCAFFDLFAAMGSEGALAKFHQNDMLSEDLVHPKGKGLDLLGELIADALLRAYAARPAVIAAQGPNTK